MHPTDPPPRDAPDFLGGRTARRRTRGRPIAALKGWVRFALYGRISTKGYQDRASSLKWQRDNALLLITGVGAIVVEYFDVGYSRAVSWPRRPEAAALLAAAAAPDRAFDAVVIGEYERAFTGRQAPQIIAQLRAYGVTVWLPELDGPVDLDDPTHQAALLVLGSQSRREVLRARMRTRNAMTAQVEEQGRHQGGRPPYGYRLVDAGPHPNRDHARWGRRLLRLDPDPNTAGHVKWMFAQRLAGASAAGIARALNERGVPSPAVYDPVRNPNRGNPVWTLRTVATICSDSDGVFVHGRQAATVESPADQASAQPGGDGIER